MQITEHFSTEELGNPPSETLPAFTALCSEILEPIRAHFDLPIRITSGYRSPEHNSDVGGVSHSQHVATPEYCACDFAMEINLTLAFEWLRLNSHLPFDQLIMESDTVGGAPKILHISWAKTPRRQALSGLTHNRSGYTSWPVTA